MFRIKICGITNVPDAMAATDAGADAIGLNFYEKSPRHITAQQSLDIAAALDDASTIRVGVFVNHSYEQIAAIASHQHLHAIQLHGDESPSFVARFGVPHTTRSKTRWQLIRALRIGDQGVAEVRRNLDACQSAGVCPDAVLLDALASGSYGGTGETVSWVGLADHRRWLGDTPLILAGGLTPDNVAEAIRIVRPAAVDVASGVESAPGKKDAIKVRDFIQAARAAFGE
jgi:phosphoribosylanthranilate isomerase